MEKMVKQVSIIYIMVLLFLGTPGIAYAYMDLGSSSAILQMILAGFGALVYSIRSFLGRIVMIFRKLLK
jgi:hypothetical protein